MNKLRSLLRMDPVAGAICAIVLLVCLAVDLSVVPVQAQQQGQQLNPNCRMYQAVLKAGGFQAWAEANNFQTSTNCMGNIPIECICMQACGVQLCKP